MECVVEVGSEIGQLWEVEPAWGRGVVEGLAAVVEVWVRVGGGGGDVGYWGGGSGGRRGDFD